MKLKWIPATDDTWDCFNKYGLFQFNPMVESATRINGVHWDFAILLHKNGTFIPCHGGIKMNAVKTLTGAKRKIREYINTIN